jgi:hypothetical protein
MDDPCVAPRGRNFPRVPTGGEGISTIPALYTAARGSNDQNTSPPKQKGSGNPGCRCLERIGNQLAD